MLKLTDIVKHYDSGPNQVEALKGVSIAFRPSEFVAILGHSGCGKTTLLNIIGGLDRYTSGDLCIRGKSTKEYKARDWDTYRNHSVGFVFQSYNLIPHQSVLANVELALTLSGVKRNERRRRAKEALEKVGLGDQIHKKPNQLSGGQMQRVAIARALVNDPEILLADEPTGALDSDTSVQIMDILREVAKDRLVIMVTHNPDLANEYATRIVRLRDGQIISDSDPYDGKAQEVAAFSKQKRSSMSLLTAFMLSLSNLMTKKGRTIMTAFAGSIGIVGIALILSISTGVNRYIEDVERDTLSSYPITLEETAMDLTSMMTAMGGMEEQLSAQIPEDKVYSQNVMSGMMDMMFSSASTNNLAAFKEYIESGNSGLEALTTEIRYHYSTPLNVYRNDLSQGVYRVNPSGVFESMGMSMGSVAGMPTMTMDVWHQLTSNKELLKSQYQVLRGRMPQEWNEVVLVLDKNGGITDYTLYALGILDIAPLQEAMQKKMMGEDVTIDTTMRTFSYDEFVGMTFKLVPTTSYYHKENGIWVDKSQDPLYMSAVISAAEDITIVGVVKPTEDASIATSYGIIGYTGELMAHLIQVVDNSQVVADQRANPSTDVLTGKPFADANAQPVIYTLDQIMAMLPSMPQEQQTYIHGMIAQMRDYGMPEAEIAATISQSLASASTATLEENLRILGVSDLQDPSAILLYPIDFEAKDAIADVIADYNAGKNEEDQILYTDMVGAMMSSVTTIINAISYVLIAFVAISLVVSSIMIGIITNISVLERTKEIGILRSVGASKRDISHVFNAETLLVGLAAGLVGIGITELLILPINLLLHTIAKIDASAYLSPVAALILIAISMLLTSIAGLVPAHSAANKDPVVALRTE